MSDNVKRPRHYEGDGRITCMDAMRSMMHGIETNAAHVTCWWGIAFRYLWRWPHKGGAEDLRKCRECLDIMLDEIESGDWLKVDE